MQMFQSSYLNADTDPHRKLLAHSATITLKNHNMPVQPGSIERTLGCTRSLQSYELYSSGYQGASRPAFSPLTT